MAGLDDRLARLATLSPAGLRQEWASVYKAEPPRLSPDLLRHGIAYRLQERAYGALPKRARAALMNLEGRVPASTSKPGTQLIRSWNGRTISVTITEDGYLFEDRTYRSLSAIAREVTGVHWSGPRFFGLNNHG